jgi:hypothetical protein
MTKLADGIALLEDIHADFGAFVAPHAHEPDDDEGPSLFQLYGPRLVERFGARFAAVGAPQFIAAYLARSDQHRRDGALLAAASLWQHLTFRDVLEVLWLIDDQPYAHYHFCWFAWRRLRIDVKALAKHPEVPRRGAAHLLQFTGSVVHFTERDLELESFAEAGVDGAALWARLAREGAPSAAGR